MGKSKKATEKKKKNNKKTNGQSNTKNPSVVGPDLFLLLQGRLFEKNVALILCGETHNDAIEVTRTTPPGQFDSIDGWITLHSDVHIALPGILFITKQRLQTLVLNTILSSPRLDQIAFRVLTQVNRQNRLVTLGRAKELATTCVEQFIEEDDIDGRHLVLLWISSAAQKNTSSRVEKGRAFLLEIKTEEEYNENNDDDDDDDDNNVVGNMTNGVATLSLDDNNSTNRRKEEDNQYDSNDDSSDDDINDWVIFPSNYEKEENPTQQINKSQLPQIVSEWMYDVMVTDQCNNNRDSNEIVATVEDVVVDEDIISHDNNNNSSNNNAKRRSSIGSYALFEWGDLDSIVHNLNKRRLGMTDDEVTEKEYDNIIQERKRILKEEHNVSTFDNWFDHVRGNQGKEKDEKGDNKEVSSASASASALPTSIHHAVHLVLESSVPPWEVELYRPNITTAVAAEDFRLHHAADCIRCLSEDSEESSEEEDNPSNDGIGSYGDFIYRRMMAASMIDDDDDKQNTNLSITTDKANVDNDYKDEKNGRKNGFNKSDWLHCIDARDLGCEAACHAEAVREKWNDLLTQEERKGLSNPNKTKNDACPVNKKGDSMRFLPANKLNPECLELERLRSKGLLVKNEYEDDDDDDEDEDEFIGLEFTFPSFELFFGQNSDNMYYSHHVKLAFSPFLANCIQSLDNFEKFFITLFFGGTVPDALNRLKIRETSNRGHIHVRSPILKRWNNKTKSYVWEERNDEEYITCPFFPFAFHLVARGSFPPRTLSSQLYANLFDFCGNEGKDGKSRQEVALAIKNSILDSIRRNMDDPKASDDKETGGEWFAAFLHANHRDIYDDIDISDASVLLQKNYMKSTTGGRPPKHNIGKIKIPSAKDSFDEILLRFEEQDRLPPTSKIITARVEILAKIIIDIWTSNLFDFSLLLKIANICSNETTDNVVVVCYVGSAHVKAANKFFCNSLGFRKKAMIGKYTWEDYELKTLDLPSKLWNLSELFR